MDLQILVGSLFFCYKRAFGGTLILRIALRFLSPQNLHGPVIWGRGHYFPYYWKGFCLTDTTYGIYLPNMCTTLKSFSWVQYATNMGIAHTAGSTTDPIPSEAQLAPVDFALALPGFNTWYRLHLVEYNQSIHTYSSHILCLTKLPN